MNYSHAFHAGNFADILKHAVLTQLLRAMTGSPGPIMVVDTHAGAGLYDLQGDAARRTGEAARGVGRLMADDAAPALFDALKAEVRRCNSAGDLRRYPGSPLLIARALRAGDTLLACELRADDHATLKAVLAGSRGVEALWGDGWSAAVSRSPGPPKALLVLIDPPFERSDERANIQETVGAVLQRNPGAIIAVWAPIKDLTGFDDLRAGIEDAACGAPMVRASVRLRPLTDPTRLNGCVMFVLNPPLGLAERAGEAAAWIANAAGEIGAEGRADVAPG